MTIHIVFKKNIHILLFFNHNLLLLFIVLFINVTSRLSSENYMFLSETDSSLLSLSFYTQYLRIERDNYTNNRNKSGLKN